MKISDIGGQADMKHIFGTIVAEEKGKVGKEDKVKIFVYLFIFYFFYFKVFRVSGLFMYVFKSF